MVCSYCASHVPFIDGEILSPLVFFIIHRLMISFKYATLSESEYKRMSSLTAVVEVIKEYHAQMQLVTGWLSVYPPFVEYEITASATRIAADLSSHRVSVASPITSSELSGLTVSVFLIPVIVSCILI